MSETIPLATDKTYHINRCMKWTFFLDLMMYYLNLTSWSTQDLKVPSLLFALATIINKFESTNHINHNKFVPMFELTQYLCSLYTPNDCQSGQDKSAIY